MNYCEHWIDLTTEEEYRTMGNLGKTYPVSHARPISYSTSTILSPVVASVA